MTRWKWMRLEQGDGAMHLVGPWARPGSSDLRYDTVCGALHASVVLAEPDGTDRCADCLARLLGSK
jgi:hypothetical protein